jgi:hypothetical protein
MAVGMLLAMPGAAHATRYDVYWEDSLSARGEPPAVSGEVLSQVLRQWNRASGNRILFEYRGFYATGTGGTHRPQIGEIVVRYGDASAIGGSPQCAYTLPSAIAWAEPYGFYVTLENDPARVPAVADQDYNQHIESMIAQETSPFAPFLCRDMYAVLNHQFAHIAQLGIDEHDLDSVRAGGNVPGGTDFAQRSLWNRDFVEISSLIHGPSRAGGYAISELDLASMTEGTLGIFPEPNVRFPTVSIALGGLDAETAVAFATEDWIMDPPDLANMSLEVRHHAADGSLLGGSSLRAIDDPEYATRYPLCLASDGGGRMLLAWASVAEREPTMCGAGLCASSGERRVMSAWSEDGGHNWSPAEPVPDATTRTGVTCTFDPTNERFVLVWSGAVDERLRLSSREFAGSWTPPFPLPPAPGRWTTPSTLEAPLIVQHASRLQLSWFDNVDDSIHAGLRWASSSDQYEWWPNESYPFPAGPLLGYLQTRVLVAPLSEGGLDWVGAWGESPYDYSRQSFVAKFDGSARVDILTDDYDPYPEFSRMGISPIRTPGTLQIVSAVQF